MLIGEVDLFEKKNIGIYDIMSVQAEVMLAWRRHDKLMTQRQ